MGAPVNYGRGPRCSRSLLDWRGGFSNPSLRVVLRGVTALTLQRRVPVSVPLAPGVRLSPANPFVTAVLLSTVADSLERSARRDAVPSLPARPGCPGRTTARHPKTTSPESSLLVRHRFVFVRDSAHARERWHDDFSDTVDVCHVFSAMSIGSEWRLLEDL